MSMGGVKYAEWKDWLNELAGIREYCEKFNQDWVFCMGGMEGAGKSTLALKTAKALDPTFDIKKQLVDSLKEYSVLTKEIKNEPFKAIDFDEAVNAFFSRSAMEKANKILVKLFITNRSYRHFHFITIPSVFYLDRYIREWRVKTFTYSWIDWQYPNRRFFAVYHRKRYKQLIMGGKAAQKAMIDKDELMRRYKPNFVTSFERLNKKDWAIYEKVKDKFQEGLLDEAITEATKLEVARKIGFHADTPLPEFLRWLIARYGYSVSGELYLQFTQEQAREDAMTRTATISYLINSLISKRYIREIKRSEYRVTEIGAKFLKSGQIHEQQPPKQQ